MQCRLIRILGICFLIIFVYYKTSFGAINPSIVQAISTHLSLPQQDEGGAAHESGHEIMDEHLTAPVELVIPFVLLLLMIATGPLFYEHFWHKNYPLIAILLALMVVAFYVFILHNNHSPIHALAEYIQFIALLTSLFIASGGILINIDKKGTPLANVVLLLSGAIIANLIGTTGASMLLIRPYIRLNKQRIRAYHIIFFIFMISNVGGALTPIGDPPLFLGFLRGVPFFWTVSHVILEWLFALLLLAGIFYFLDRRNASTNHIEENHTYTNKLTIIGSRNFFWLAFIITAVFIDPNKFDWVPYISYEGQRFSFLREFIMFSVAFLSYRFASKDALKGNDFRFEPIKEVAFIFIGIFGTMMPALELIGDFAQSEAGAALVTPNTLYWSTGTLSGFLDNAPTYLNFLAAALASQGADVGSTADVLAFAEGAYKDSILHLTTISIAAVFFGAMTYIGNGPNFMVKSIAEQMGIDMPSFFGYIIRFSLPFLLPILFLVWLVFFA
ncbi:sodium:proton antiporter [Catalinimonas niigatensis]|uniref:sodium:proton antiporter n=1 Tax=Catalinimonas niigatensis TaxID=1397264 RepID=UPI0026659347|nr:sodium:proton antiporter [Catalinimonas niigatensis]WPP52426.1 sodium:proton antiporter [Catalinimonas niigatensis]